MIRKINLFILTIRKYALYIALTLFVIGIYLSRDVLGIPDPKILIYTIKNNFAFFTVTLLMFALWIIVATNPILDKDQKDRKRTADLEKKKSLRNASFARYVATRSATEARAKAEIKQIIEEKFGDDLVTAVSRALAQRVDQESKTIKSIRHLEQVTTELKYRLEGPAGRAENHARIARQLAYSLATIGLIIALWRVYTLKDLTASLTVIYAITKGQSVWPFIIAHTAPWFGLILLIEFTALLFVRFSTQASMQQRYFTEAYTELKDRHAALRTIIEYGSPE
ncbi:hypothetical protein [Pseudochrobactrum asaccharolyticum]|uniref:hypothetical protein n=1 Tax=Pseudochrobactrum asaccharolyticum TaxID=354351 RepID=UPI00404310B1